MCACCISNNHIKHLFVCFFQATVKHNSSLLAFSHDNATLTLNSSYLRAVYQIMWKQANFSGWSSGNLFLFKLAWHDFIISFSLNLRAGPPTTKKITDNNSTILKTKWGMSTLPKHFTHTYNELLGEYSLVRWKLNSLDAIIHHFWRTNGTVHAPKNTIPIMTFGGGKIMVWGFFYSRQY